MNNDQKEILRDCFEGCMSADYAIALIAEIAGPRAARDAIWTWERWEREIDEEGCYTF